MGNLKFIISIGIVTGLLLGCSSVRVVDAWQGVDKLNIKDKNILVVSKTEDRNIQVCFEKDMVSKLRDYGLKSIESHVQFPCSDPTEKVTKDEMKEVIKNLKQNGIDVVMVSHLVESKEYKTLVTRESIYIDHFPIRYLGYRSFFAYTNSYYSQYETREIEGVTHVLETLVYDLTRSTEDQLISVITVEVDNPRSVGNTANHFSKRIVRRLTR